MTDDRDELDKLWKAVEEAGKEPNPDYSWADDLPEAPPIPERPGETIAVFIPTRHDGRKTESQ